MIYALSVDSKSSQLTVVTRLGHRRCGLAGMALKLATAGEAKSGHAGPAKTPEVASLALPARGAWGGMLYLKYRLVPCSSRAAGVVSRYSGLVNEARLLESTLFM